MDVFRKRVLCALMALALLAALPIPGLAAKKPSIKLGVKLGLMYAGEAVRLKPKLTRVSRQDVGFDSSAPEVATVDASGEIQALKEGRTVITASGGGAVARCGVVVLPRRVTLSVGEQRALPNGTLEKYRVKNKKIATVSAKGVLRGKKAGATSVAVKYGRQVLTVAVTVCVALFEGELTGALFGFLLGFAIDVTVAAQTGVTALTLMLVGTATGGSWIGDILVTAK